MESGTPALVSGLLKKISRTAAPVRLPPLKSAKGLGPRGQVTIGRTKGTQGRKDREVKEVKDWRGGRGRRCLRGQVEGGTYFRERRGAGGEALGDSLLACLPLAFAQGEPEAGATGLMEGGWTG